MANFMLAYQTVLRNEGLYSNDQNDNGGETVLGISRNNFPSWAGWSIVDATQDKSQLAKNATLVSLVQVFYLENFWNPIMGDNIQEQDVADSIFDFAVNAGIKTSIRLAQSVVGTKDDGIIGTQTVYALNAYSPSLFVAQFKLKKIERYCNIVDKNATQLKYLKGWCRRALR